ncbi:hypothetical protein QNM97_21475 [Gordonia sp. L191]|uniref:Uncharacterized protein n=1 Tax=Gordonia oryzae TaxID=2487349 RepID=A0A3N4GIP3_9ACTN|nr:MULTISPECIES: hypothetical protein [Gordonia]RPA59041.1 hypothetical protein EF294_14560 [Gordonia oryzae]WHU46521.1 hypothetical protein QNM97_21475 [Gordonia sp. L191]
MIDLYILDVPENAGIVTLAHADASLSTSMVGPYYRIHTEESSLEFDRKATGCRHAVWYSAIAGLAGGTVVVLDKHMMRVETE